MDWYTENTALQAELRREYPAVAELIEELERQLAEARAETERLRIIISGKTFADERKQVAKEIIKFIRACTFQDLTGRGDGAYCVDEQDITEIGHKFGLEG